jgi:hypothetical protein
MKSNIIKKGIEKTPHRSLLKASGLTDEEIKRPLIGVVNSKNDIVPGHIHINTIADAVCTGVKMAGGTPLQFPAIAVCDGIAMGHEGMKYSLATRELICDSIEAMAKAHAFDALVLIPNCDKVVPGMLMAAARVNIPTIVVSGGAMLSLPGADGTFIDLNSTFEAVVNWPVAWRAYLYKLKAVLDSGKIGKPIKMRYINGHTGPLGKGAKHRGVSENAEEMTDEVRGKTWWHQQSHGGGVYLDIACYGCYFTKWLMGDGEKTVLSYGNNLNTSFGDTDDNFVAVVGYDGKMSVIEGTWTTPRVAIPSGPMVLCTDGIVMCTGGAENHPDVVAYDIYGNEIKIDDVELDNSYQNMPWHYVNHILNDVPISEMLTLKANMEIMKILDAVMRSSKSGKIENI